MDTQRLRQLAELGVKIRIRELTQELRALSAEFPAIYLRVTKEMEGPKTTAKSKPTARRKKK